MWVYANVRRLESFVDFRARLHLVSDLRRRKSCQVCCDDTSDVTGISGLNSVSEDESTMFKKYRGLLPIKPRWYESPSGTCRSDDLSVAPSCSGEQDARDITRLYKDTMRDDVTELGDTLASIRAPTQQELKIAQHVGA